MSGAPDARQRGLRCATPAAGGPGPPRRVNSAELLPAGRPLHIVHGVEVYVLRRTANGKLILTK
jgi:hemin uptake protein HemP